MSATGIGGLLEMHLAAQAVLNGYETILRTAGLTTTADLLRDRALNDVGPDGYYRFAECQHEEGGVPAEKLAHVLNFLKAGSFQDFRGYGVNYSLENLEGIMFKLLDLESVDSGSDRFFEVSADTRRIKDLIYDHTDMFPELPVLLQGLSLTLNRP